MDAVAGGGGISGSGGGSGGGIGGRKGSVMMDWTKSTSKRIFAIDDDESNYDADNEKKGKSNESYVRNRNTSFDTPFHSRLYLITMPPTTKNM